MAGGAEGREDSSSSLRIAGRRRIGREGVAWDIGSRPRPESLDEHVDLCAGEHSSFALRKRRHLGAGDSRGGYITDGRIVGNGQEDGISQRNRRAAFAVRSVTAGTVLFIKSVEIQNLFRTH